MCSPRVLWHSEHKKKLGVKNCEFIFWKRIVIDIIFLKRNEDLPSKLHSELAEEGKCGLGCSGPS